MAAATKRSLRKRIHDIAGSAAHIPGNPYVLPVSLRSGIFILLFSAVVTAAAGSISQRQLALFAAPDGDVVDRLSFSLNSIIDKFEVTLHLSSSRTKH